MVKLVIGEMRIGRTKFTEKHLLIEFLIALYRRICMTYGNLLKNLLYLTVHQNKRETMKKLFTLLCLVAFQYGLWAHSTSHGILSKTPQMEDPGFYGMWTISIENGRVGWLEVHNKAGYLDANLLWSGGSVLPVANVYFADDKTLVVTRIQTVTRSEDAGNERKHTITTTFKMIREGDKLAGFMLSPRRNGMGLSTTAFTGVRLPPVPPAPDLSAAKYGTPIQLFNGKNLDGWKMIDPKSKNGFMVENGVLINKPVQEAGHHVRYGNLRTEQEFEDFNLKLEVKVPSGNNSGIYLRGMYEIQVFDSYGKELDSHHMGAVYSRITPAVAAEKPAGEWQSFDITLYDRHITVVLNGKTIVDNEPVYGPTGGAIIADVFAPGPIYLQGDHGEVAYRNIVLRPIVK